MGATPRKKSGRVSRRVDWDARETVFTDSEVQEALSAIRGRLRRSGRILFRGHKMTKEATFGALVLWADAQPAEALEALLGPFVARLEALVAAKGEAQEKPPETADGGRVEGVTIRTVNPRRRKPSSGVFRPDRHRESG